MTAALVPALLFAMAVSLATFAAAQAFVAQTTLSSGAGALAVHEDVDRTCPGQLETTGSFGGLGPCSEGYCIGFEIVAGSLESR